MLTLYKVERLGFGWWGILCVVHTPSITAHIGLWVHIESSAIVLSWLQSMSDIDTCSYQATRVRLIVLTFIKLPFQGSPVYSTLSSAVKLHHVSRTAKHRLKWGRKITLLLERLVYEDWLIWLHHQGIGASLRPCEQGWAYTRNSSLAQAWISPKLWNKNNIKKA